MTSQEVIKSYLSNSKNRFHTLKEMKEYVSKYSEEMLWAAEKPVYAAALELEQLANTEEFYRLRAILGNDWAMLFFLLGGREAGKSYAVTRFFVDQFVNKGRDFVWLRLSEQSARKLLNNNAEKLIDPDIRRQYNLDLWTSNDLVYVVKRNAEGRIIEKKQMARVMSISTFYNDKGSGLFDADYLKQVGAYRNICLDEMNREKGERKTFDIVYNFANQLENLCRSTKYNTRVICIGNTLEEASDILASMGFIPEKFGTYKLVKNKKLLLQYISECRAHPDQLKEINWRYRNVKFGKRAIIDYIEPSDIYLSRRNGTFADILCPTASTFTNAVKVDDSLVTKQKLIKPVAVIHFDAAMFTVWDGSIVAKYHNEKVNTHIAMQPYMDLTFDPKLRDQVYLLWNTRSLRFHDLITYKLFKKQLELLKPKA